MLFMSRVTVETTAPLADFPGSNLFDRDEATAAMTGSLPFPWFSLDLGGSLGVTKVHLLSGDTQPLMNLEVRVGAWNPKRLLTGSVPDSNSVLTGNTRCDRL